MYRRMILQWMPLCAAIFPTLALAQATKFVTEFPAGSTPMAQEEAMKTLNGKSISFIAADGWGLRIQYKSNGYFFFDTSTGQRGSGTWLIRESKVCSVVQGDPKEVCSELRRDGARVFLKRGSNNEVVELKIFD